MKQYSEQNLKNMLNKPKLGYFMPLIGYFLMMKDLNSYEKEAGLMDKTTPGGMYISKITKKFFTYLNILFVVVLVITLITVVPQWFFWKKHILKAVSLNDEQGLYIK